MDRIRFLLAALHFFPLFHGLTKYANPALAAAQARAPVTVVADPRTCSFQFNPVGTSEFVNSCDIAKSFLAKASVNYRNVDAPAGTVAAVHVGDRVIESFEGATLSSAERKAKVKEFYAALAKQINAVGYPGCADPIT